ncbi:hypothetical protein IWW36_003381 [Coemansia brasiliensis]|uniref:Uncharacterized protein n=1 Tax=Coemansia brasiliensis TaxID=2650707 RepID=A0A9W8LYL3_9FUNG|nr:hypothetical protein IWW36_003381 [Coemansia brasiliensis]
MFTVHTNIGYNPERCGSCEHRMQTLRNANDALELPLVCLSRIREPLGHLGGYWNMDPEIVFSVTAGSLNTVISAIEQMRQFLAYQYGAPDISEETNQNIQLFLDRSSAWVRANRFNPCESSFTLSATEQELPLDNHYDY